VHPMTIENIDFIVDKINLKEVSLPSGEICDLLKKKTNRQFLALKQSNKDGVITIMILELRHRDKLECPDCNRS
jgi:hypothetical protein